jgi:two-component system NtrC family sensor kinase
MKAVESPNISNIWNGIDKGNHVSCRVTNSLLRYLESLHYDSSSILEGLPYTKEYLSDPLNWVPYSVREELQHRASELVGDAKIMYKVGLSTPKLNSISGVEHMVRLVGTPKLVYQSIPKYASLFDKITKFETQIVDDCKAVVAMSVIEGYPCSKQACYYAQGILAAIPTLWGLPPAEVNEKQCACDTYAGDITGKTSHYTTKCIYEVTWQPIRPLPSRLGDRLFRRGNDNTYALKKLETNFRLLDKKNAELVQRNNQLSKVREIALGIDNAVTVDEVLRLVVGNALEIPGIRFVVVNELDEERQMVTTPYYSKLRNDALYAALRAIGFDPDIQLGSNEADSKLVFKPNKLILDYITNPRIIVKDHLSEFLSGIWPKFLCDSIQRILSIKRLILMPITPGTTPWMSMTFFLDGNVPIDVLEMIVAHCNIALKKVSTLAALELRNAELSSINAIIRRTSSSLDLDKMLDAAVDELVSIFKVDTAAIYLVNEDGDALKLHAQRGMSAEMVNISKVIPLGDNIFAKHFLLNEGVLSGDLSKYSDEFPQHGALVQSEGAIPFITATLYSRQKRHGLVTIVHTGGKDFTQEDESILLSIANQLSLSIENAKLHRDVTDSENRLNLIIQSVSEGITVTDLEGRIQQVNGSVIKMHGYGTKEELTGLNAFQLITKKDQDRAMENLRHTLATGQSAPLEYTFVKKDGTEFPGELSASLIKDINGNPMGFVASSRDISERREAELKLRESERKYRLITDSTTDLISMLTFKGTYAYVSPSIRKMGYEPEELLGKSGFDFIHPDDKKRLLPLMGKYTAMKLQDLFGLKKESQSEQIQFRFRDKSGNWHYIEAVANLVDAMDRNGLNILLTSRDMTDRKLIEDSLRESEEKYRMIFESANDIIILLDKKGNIIDVNGKIRDIGGYDREDLRGKSFRVLNKIMPQKSIDIITENLTKTMLGLSLSAYEVEMYKSSGELVNIEINTVGVKKNGKMVGSLATLRDITDRRKSEIVLKRQKELIDRILENTPTGVLVIDNNKNVVLANRTFCESFALKKNTLEGKGLSKLIPMISVSDAVSTVLARKQSYCNIEFNHVVEKCNRTYVGNVIAMGENEVLIIIDDVTEERERRERLYLTDRLASVGEMASGIAHELNNPLTGVIGLSQLLVNEESLPEDLKEDTQAIYSEAQRAAGIVRNLLTFARKHIPVREPTQLNKVLEDVLRLRAYEHKVNNIEVNTTLDPELPQIMTDYFQMQQVFLNIILNAESAMLNDHKQGRLIITTELVDGVVKVSFLDNGPGIPKENLSRLFDPFFTTKEVGKGTGLGLSICYGIVSSHGGRIYAQSERRKGAKFIVELPINIS